MLTIRFNGQDKEVPPDTSIAELLVEAGVPIQFCAVERNLEIVPKPEYQTVKLQEGDSIEVVTLVGGG